MRPRSLTAVVALSFALAFAHGALSARAQAQSRAATTAQRALDALDLSACRPATDFDARTVPLAIVIHGGGAWALAVGPTAGNGIVSVDALASFRTCLERALSGTLPQPLTGAGRTASVVTRTWTIPTPAELWVDQRITAVQAATHRCVAGAVGHAREVRARVRIARGDDGQTTVSALRPSRSTTAVATCLAQVLGPLPDALTPIERDVTSAPPPAPPADLVAREPVSPHHGHEGDVCRWGERRGEIASLPRPHRCRGDLTCCAAGGAAGSDSTCIRVQGRCPAYP